MTNAEVKVFISPLVKANISEQPESRLSEAEMLAQMQYVSFSILA
jgi:hypothetical protein